MNERIRELSYQCWYNDSDTGKEEFDRVKFAELIVRECCVTADANIDDSKYPSYWIKKRFGVEQ